MKHMLKRSPFKKKLTKPMKRTKLRVAGHSTTSEDKQEIQRLVREIVMLRDKGCILRKLRNCGGDIDAEAVLQADHLITRSNSATYADTRLIVCVCRNCHGWKRYWEQEYNALVKTIISKERIKLWERCEADRKQHKTYKVDWKMEILALNHEWNKMLSAIIR